LKKLKVYYLFHPVTSTIIIINLSMAILVFFSGGFTSVNLVSWGALVPYNVLELNEYHRILTATFLHGSIFHFLMNAYVLYYIGGNLERLIGPRKYILIYLIAGIVSSLFVVFLSNPFIPTIGASGSIFGVMGALFILTLRKKEWFPARVISSIRNLILINLGFTFLVPNISIPGHIGGLVAGLLFTLILIPKKPYYLKYIVDQD
jgi:rhomboid protease GluP